jgi:hypothetical protein
MRSIVTGHKADKFLQRGWAEDGMPSRAQPFGL